MSATSRSRAFIDIPLRRGDTIADLFTTDDALWVRTLHGRTFRLTRVARYKRRFKCQEIVAGENRASGSEERPSGL